MSLYARLMLLAGLVFTPAARAEAPFILGISTHLMNYERPVRPPLKLAAEAGFNAVKDDVFWSTVQPTPSQWRIFPQWRIYLNTAESLNMSRLAILGYSTWFHDNAKPRTPALTQAFLAYVDYVTRQLGNHVSYYEIWNEWDLEAPKDRQSSVDYAALVRRTAPVIRKNTRRVNGIPAKILAGAVTPDGMRFGFVDSLIDSGALDMVDGLSVHPYAHCSDENTPEAWLGWMSRYEQYVRNRAGRDVPIYLTEMAWPSHKGHCGNSEATQALYMARIFFLARTVPNVKGMWWYDLYNDGPNPRNQEHNFGILNEDLSPKPAYTMAKAIAPVVRDFTYDARASVIGDGVYQLYFNKGKERVLVAWTTGEPRPVQITAKASLKGPVRLIDTVTPDKGQIASGAAWVCQSDQCSASIPLTPYPKLIRLTP